MKDEEKRGREEREREEGGRPDLSCVSMVDGYERSHMRVQCVRVMLERGTAREGEREKTLSSCVGKRRNRGELVRERLS